MSPRICLRISKSAVLPRPQLCAQWTLPLRARRSYANEKSYAERPLENNVRHDTEPTGPNMEQLPHVSEEAAAMSKIQGEQGPEIEEHGTPVQEVIKGDEEAQKHLPKVMKEQLKKDESESSSGSRSYSTWARRSLQPSKPFSRAFSTSSHSRLDVQREYEMLERPSWQPMLARSHMEGEEIDEEFEDEDGDFEYEPDEDEIMPAMQHAGHKFPLPPHQLPPNSHLHKRYEPLIDQVTKLLMRHGKLATAQRNMSAIFTHLATSPAPRPSPNHQIILKSTPPSALPLNPPLYLSVAIDSVAPIVRIRSQKGAAGGGVALQIPVPLHQRQRRRTAVMWMLDQVDKRKGGTSPFAKRFAEECIAIVEGRSSVWERRSAVHGLGIRGRVNVAVGNRRKRF